MIKKILFLLFLLVVLLFFYFKKEKVNPTLSLVKGNKETVVSIVKKLEPLILDRLIVDLQRVGLESFPDKIKLVAFKEERLLLIFGEKEGKWQKIKTYPFTAFSGQLGPKLKEGDLQIPEGFYKISFLNPNSSYHLSMQVDYPNAFDKQKASAEGRTNLGGDIFIHGKNVTIGCIPIGDEAIEELFLLAAKTIDRGIDIIISPRNFRNNSTFPTIESVIWEKELYENIADSLAQLED